MKKIFTAVLVGVMMLLGSQAFAQISVGGGYKMFTHKIGDSDPFGVSGVYAQVDYNIPLVGSLSLVPAVNFTYAHSKIHKGIYDGCEMTEQYLEIPVRLNLGINITESVKGFVFAGPAFDFGISSQLKSSLATVNTYKEDGSDYKRLNILVGGGAGVAIKDILKVVVGYDCGLVNRYNKDFKWNTNQLYTGVAIIF